MSSEEPSPAPPEPTTAADASPAAKSRASQIRPKGVHTKHLTELERFRVRTLYYDACMTKRRIQEVTGYSESQIRTAVRAKSFEIGKRTGRPRKGYKIHGPVVGEGQDGSPGSAEEEAQASFQEDSMMSMDEEVQGQLLANALQSPGPTATATAAPPSRPRGFSDLPEELRLQIWKLVVSAAAPPKPLRRSWSFVTQPSAPWLFLDTSYAAEALRSPPWSSYIERRHEPAMALCRVSREARQAVLDAFTPVVVTSSPAPATGTTAAYFEPMPAFVWVDLAHDNIGFFGATPYSPDMFEKARRAALPAVWWRG
ncbi:hypothetical protein F5X99DRAFT_304640 [Biscogniauxia marginata]|nr:hypothetical protein F5X99DRAFT_304640 [Biscogniauxia marginata]